MRKNDRENGEEVNSLENDLFGDSILLDSKTRFRSRTPKGFHYAATGEGKGVRDRRASPHKGNWGTKAQAHIPILKWRPRRRPGVNITKRRRLTIPHKERGDQGERDHVEPRG